MTAKKIYLTCEDCEAAAARGSTCGACEPATAAPGRGHSAAFDALLAASSLARHLHADRGVDAYRRAVDGAALCVQCKHSPAAGHTSQAAGDDAIHELLSAQNRAMVYRYARSRLTEPQLAEELVVEVFALALRRLRNSAAHGRDPGALLIGIARKMANQRVDAQRRSATADLARPLPRPAPGGGAQQRDQRERPATDPDPGASRAVLIGASRYGELPPLPGVEPSVEHLARLLRGVGVPRSTVLRGEQVTRASVLHAVDTAAAKATDTVIVHFAGHGRIDRDALVLGTADTAPDTGHHPLGFADLYRWLGTTRARRILIILDACASGLAVNTARATAQAATDTGPSAREEYVLAATGEQGWALAGDGGRGERGYSAYTGALIEVLTEGVPEPDGELDVFTVHRAVDRKLAASGLPRPMLFATGPQSLTLGPNPRKCAWRSPRPAAPNEAVEKLLRGTRDCEQDAWDALVERYSRSVWSTATAFRLTDAEAADVCQTVWLRLVEDLDLVTAATLGSWLTTAAQHEAAATLRRRGEPAIGAQPRPGSPPGGALADGRR